MTRAYAAAFAARDAITAAIREHSDMLALAMEATGDRMRRMGADWRGPCPLHGGANPNFSVNPGSGLWHCFTCGVGGDVFDFAMQWRSLDFLGARRFLGDRIGVPVDGPTSGAAFVPLPPRPPREPSPAEQRRAAHVATLDALRAEGCVPSAPSEIYASMLQLLTLESRGADYLNSRGLDPIAAAHCGFRSVPSDVEWTALQAKLEESYLEAELALAGLTRMPWGGRVPALVIPYLGNNAVVGLRFRNLSPTATKAQRYQSLAGAQPPLPFNADALTNSRGALHLVEGELNALSLTTYGLRAIGLPGATSWRDEWVKMITKAVAPDERLIAWYDNDAAGAKARDQLGQRLLDARGAEWMARHAQSFTLFDGDANDHHRDGILRSQLEEAGFL